MAPDAMLPAQRHLSKNLLVDDCHEHERLNSMRNNIEHAGEADNVPFSPIRPVARIARIIWRKGEVDWELTVRTCQCLFFRKERAPSLVC